MFGDYLIHVVETAEYVPLADIDAKIMLGNEYFEFKHPLEQVYWGMARSDILGGLVHFQKALSLADSTGSPSVVGQRALSMISHYMLIIGNLYGAQKHAMRAQEYVEALGGIYPQALSLYYQARCQTMFHIGPMPPPKMGTLEYEVPKVSILRSMARIGSFRRSPPKLCHIIPATSRSSARIVYGSGVSATYQLHILPPTADPAPPLRPSTARLLPNSSALTTPIRPPPRTLAGKCRTLGEGCVEGITTGKFPQNSAFNQATTWRRTGYGAISVLVAICDGELAARQSSASSGTRKFGLLGGQIQRGSYTREIKGLVVK
ncbi:hypothetical protein C8J57DRAFT_1240798 [Mycena rebaudengoi]|nr:hypothetical protein C8J57DRAFT_1240798 [Mycena rebaudengoi]